MAKFRYFELDEFILSDTAKARRIDNTPTFEVVEHLAELTGSILDPLRAAYGRPIVVSSGYRCQRLNAAVGGSPTSAHMRGYAADLLPKYGDVRSFAEFVAAWLRKSGTKFDQCLIEMSQVAAWVHIGMYNNQGWQRCEIKNITLK